MTNDSEQARPSGDAKDYVLVTRVDPNSGEKFTEEVFKSEFETSEKYADLSYESEEVREAHPPENQPAYGLGFGKVHRALP
jgi:hypothetical protein